MKQRIRLHYLVISEIINSFSFRDKKITKLQLLVVFLFATYDKSIDSQTYEY